MKKSIYKSIETCKALRKRNEGKVNTVSHCRHPQEMKPLKLSSPTILPGPSSGVKL